MDLGWLLGEVASVGAGKRIQGEKAGAEQKSGEKQDRGRDTGEEKRK